ncbi:alpha/beta fold hydrolase [Schaalia sp. Marseille-Q2122]|uniref:alpha/beta fold hydrolase n=1 Tax=Schaalia sp. Marseille-Q2122 TaxID=2736604 RepID=UPI00158B176F|nr:alpha/beta fold hydrolase [Schaalia sp. Marseille-Q2122]
MTEWTVKLTVDGTADAPVLVLGHSLGSSHTMWDWCLPLLTPHFRVVRFDLPGHGGSAPAPIDEPLTMDALLHALEVSLNKLGVGQFHIAGLSIGGLIALAAAERMPERLLSSTIMASGPVNGTPEMWAERADLVRTQGTEAIVDVTMERWFSASFAGFGEAPAAVAEWGRGASAVSRIRRAFIECDNEGYAQCCEILATTDLRPGLAEVTVPTMIVNGSEDAGFDNAAACALRQALSASPSRGVVHVEGAKHMCAVEQPELVAQALVEWNTCTTGDGFSTESALNSGCA